MALYLAEGVKKRLEALCISELKKTGIDVSVVEQHHKPSTVATKESPEQNSVFGKALIYQETAEVAGCGPVPRLLIDLRSRLEEHYHIEGIFRKPGAAKRVGIVKAELNLGKPIPPEAQVHDLAVIVKMFLRELPEPVLTKQLTKAFEAAGRQESQVLRNRCVHMLCMLLPRVHLSTLAYFMSLLEDVASHYHENKMTESNLAICVADILFALTKDSKTAWMKLNYRLRVVHGLIGMAKEIVSVPYWLEERLYSPEEFPSEDDGSKKRGFRCLTCL